MKNCVRVTGIDVRKLVSLAYAASMTVGEGVKLYESGPLPEKDVEEIVGQMLVQETGLVLQVLEVKGRAVELRLYRDEEGALWVPKAWPYHTEMTLFWALKEAGWAPQHFNRPQVKAFMMAGLSQVPCVHSFAERLVNDLFREYDNPDSLTRKMINALGEGVSDEQD